MARSPRTDTKFRRLYDENFVAIRNYCLRRLPVSEVSDAMSEIFLITWRRIDTAPDGNEATLWLYGVARHVIRNAGRSIRRRARLNGRLKMLRDGSAPGPETIVIRQNRDAELLVALAELRPRDQEILRLSVWEELSNTEIASVLAIDPHAATMRLSRARNRFAVRLGMAKQLRTNRTAGPQPVRKGGEQ